jgi:hypothetical protein
MNEIIFFPWNADCPLCASLQRLSPGTNCPFCLVEIECRKYCKACARDEKFIHAEWSRRSLSKRFTTFARWDNGARAYIQGWCLDLTRHGLHNTRHSAIWREARMNGAVNLVVYRDQPVFALNALRPTAEEPKGMLVPRPTPLEVGAVSKPAVLSNDDLLHRQKRVMGDWQKRARKKSESFRREHKDLNRGDALNLFAAAFPDYARLVTEHLCRRCGGFAGVKAFICETCK